MPPMRAVRAVWRGYADALRRRPYITSSVTGGVVMLSGDTLAQHYEARAASAPEGHRGGHSGSAGSSGERKHDRVRAAVMVGFSMCAFMPVNTLWYRNVVERCGQSVSCRILRSATESRLHVADDDV